MDLKKSLSGDIIDHKDGGLIMKGFFIALLVIVSVMAGCGKVENVENSYDALAEWSDDEANLSWLPDFVPGEAFKLREIHNLDTNLYFGMYSYKDTPLREGVKVRVEIRNTVTLKMAAVERPPRPKWFVSDKTLQRKTDLRFYSVGNTYFTEDTKAKRVYYFSAAEGVK